MKKQEKKKKKIKLFIFQLWTKIKTRQCNVQPWIRRWEIHTQFKGNVSFFNTVVILQIGQYFSLMFQFIEMFEYIFLQQNKHFIVFLQDIKKHKLLFLFYICAVTSFPFLPKKTVTTMYCMFIKKRLQL